MTIALIADIHANLPALEAVLEDIDRRNPDQIYCLGDLVGYNIWPNEVIENIRKRRIPTIAGNHDLKISTMDPASEESPKNYAYRLISPSEKQYLQTLPAHIRLEFNYLPEPLHMLLVHGSPLNANEYLFEDTDEAVLLKHLEDTQANILCVGHTHKPYHRTLYTQKEGKDQFKHIINTGSVGKPKDGDPRACYVLVELDLSTDIKVVESLSVEFIRVQYDVEKAAKAVEGSLLPNEWANMLRQAY